jgi:tryptophan synthase alpha chain
VGGLDVQAIAEHAAETKKVASVPVCVGFGISTPEDVRSLAPFVDGVIIGSALVKLAHNKGDVAGYVQNLKAALQ